MYPPDEELDTDEKVFAYAVEWGGETGRGIIGYALDCLMGIEVNGNWYEYEECKAWYDKLKCQFAPAMYFIALDNFEAK